MKSAVKVKEENEKTELADIALKKNEIDINVAHNQWGHHCLQRLSAMARKQGLKLKGVLEPCDTCGIAKASQK